MSTSESRPCSQITVTRTSQIKKQISQRVSSRLRDKRLMEIKQTSTPEYNPKPELVRTKRKSQLATAEQSMTVVGMSGHKAPPITATHATSESDKDTLNPAHYHPHNVDRREKRKNERISKLQAVIKQKDVEIKRLQKTLYKQEKEMKKLQHTLMVMTDELHLVKQALTEASNEVTTLKKQHTTDLRKLDKLQKSHDSTVADFMASETTIERLEEEKVELKQVLSEFQEFKKLLERNSPSCKQAIVTKQGREYAPVIRKLYYSLLSSQIPASRAAEIVKAVLKCFLPDCDVDNIQLPSERCAGYMRKDELTTISTAHKVSVLFKTGQSLHINTDGTTKQQRKINSAAVNGIVISVNEVPDGTAESIVNDINSELEKLRNAAKDLGLPNHMSINWNMFASATSDSASTQAKFNKLIEMHREEDEKKFGQSAGGMELITNFCAMHLGANLRKSFISGIHKLSETEKDNADREREHNQTDNFIHEFTKLFGQQGVPEYCLGILQLRDYIQLQLEQETDPEKISYYQECESITFERQVGSRYFVSAANAGKILFMTPLAVEFLEYTGKHSGNKLEKSVYLKLKDPQELARLKADAIMFHHVYADLVMLAKSNDLQKSAFDMGQHYLELMCFLEEMERYPENCMDCSYQVFSSEPQLYGSNKLINHRKRTSHQIICNRLFREDEWDNLLYSCLKDGASAMKAKLSTYAANQLPGGKYWKPEPQVEAVLRQLRPNNDLCESILGLNDYLVTALPNMAQQTRTNLIEVKKNKTISWLESLSPKQQEHITKLAIRNRRAVQKQCAEKQKCVAKQRRQHMMQAKLKRDRKMQKQAEEHQRLSKAYLIASVREFDTVISDINDQQTSSAKKRAKILSLLKEQVRIREKLLHQRCNIKFSRNRKQRPLTELVKEVRNFISKYDDTTATAECTHTDDPMSLVGKQVLHKFMDETDREEWYSGYIVAYNCAKQLHEIAYENEDDHCHFNLMEDLKAGDLKVFL